MGVIEDFYLIFIFVGPLLSFSVKILFCLFYEIFFKNILGYERSKHITTNKDKNKYIQQSLLDDLTQIEIPIKRKNLDFWGFPSLQIPINKCL